MLLFAPFAGVWADRWNRHRMVIGAQLLFMLQAAALAALALSGRATIAQILALSLLGGFVNAVDVPARQSFMLEMVGDRADLPNAIALNSSIFNVARLIGPSIAGVLLGVLSEGMVFLLNALSYVAVLGALFAIRVAPRQRPETPAPPLWTHLGEGLRYVMHFSPTRAVLLLLAVVGLVAAPYSVLMPIFATDVLHGGAHTLGFLVASIGVGALGGALYLARRQSVRGLGAVIAWAAGMFGVALVAFALVRREWLACVVLAVSGFGMMTHMAASNTVIQTLVDHDKRGRVMSLYAMAMQGTMPLGALAAGALAGRIGAPLTVGLGGAACVVAAALFARALPALRTEVRPVYARLGIIPEVAVALEAAEEPSTAPSIEE
jgi:MFS family permease